MTRARTWCFTINNPGHGNDRYAHPAFVHGKMRYLTYQLEKGESGTVHWQGYVEFLEPLRLSSVRELLPDAHLEQRKGTQEEAIRYCHKKDTRVPDTDYFEYGSRAVAGKKRSGLQGAISLIQQGGSIRDVAEQESETFVKHFKGLRELSEMSAPKRSEKTRVFIFYGDSGSGKSHKAHEMFPNRYVVPKSTGNAHWFNDYEAGQDIILDDFYGWLPMSFMLEFMDKYPMRLPTKGGFVNMTAKNIVILSNSPWEEWYKAHFEKVPMHRKAFVRRVENIWHFTGEYGVTEVKITKEKCEWLDASKLLETEENKCVVEGFPFSPPSSPCTRVCSVCNFSNCICSESLFDKVFF